MKIKIKVPKKYNFPVGMPIRILKPVKRLLVYKDVVFDKTIGKYLTRVINAPFPNQYRIIDLLDKTNPVYYNYLRRGYISIIEFCESQFNHDILIEGE